jgi:hypothetical protein
MSDTDYLSLQINVICLLLFILGIAAILERPLEQRAAQSNCHPVSFRSPNKK